MRRRKELAVECLYGTGYLRFIEMELRNARVRVKAKFFMPAYL